MNPQFMPGGLFLALDGPEGAGKTVHARRLRDWLADLGFSTVLTREPGGTALGEQLRQIVLDRNSTALNSWSELFLFLAARAQLVEEVIRPSLEAGKVVVSDRYSTSTMAYQGYGLGVDRGLVRQMNQCATGGLEPALTLILDIDPRDGLARLRGGGLLGDRIEDRDSEFFDRVRHGYLEIASEEPERFQVIDASAPEEEVWERVRAAVSALLALRSPGTPA